MIKLVEIEPMGYVRQTRADSWKDRPVVLRYRAFRDELRLKLGDFKLSDDFSIVFGLPFPKSYSKKKRAELLGKPHQVKPDLDNLVKSFSDAVRGKGEENDSRIHHFEARKVWDIEGFIKIINIE